MGPDCAIPGCVTVPSGLSDPECSGEYAPASLYDAERLDADNPDDGAYVDV